MLFHALEQWIVDGEVRDGTVEFWRGRAACSWSRAGVRGDAGGTDEVTAEVGVNQGSAFRNLQFFRNLLGL